MPQDSNAPEPDHLAGSLAPDMPPDPLLQSGSFIDANASNGQTLFNTSPKQNHQMDQLPDPPVFGVPPPSAAGEDSIAADPVTPAPVPVNSAPPAEAKARRGRSKRSEPPSSSSAGGIPDWLPPSWIVEDRVRNSGATAGMVDKEMEFLFSMYGVVILESFKYYYDPVSGHRFRSKNEVLYFLHTGSVRKKRKLGENSDADTENYRQYKHKRPRAPKVPALNFDFVNVPEKIRWVLTDSSGGTWTPFIGDEKVAESSKREWNAAFESLTVRNDGNATR